MLRGRLLLVSALGAALLIFPFFTLYYSSFETTKPRVQYPSFLKLSNWLNVKNETLGFARIFAIGMPDRSDKRDAFSLAASLSGMQFEWMDGVDGAKVSNKALPDSWSKEQSNGTLGCWRAHMNVMQKIVKEQISTALLMEDDADWDIHIKSQLVEFARGSRYIQGQEARTTNSPYGDDWDLLWLGHCGARNREDLDQRYYIIHDDPTAVPQELWGWPRRQPNFTPPQLNGTFSRAMYKPVRGLCTFSYAVSLRGARRLLEDQALSGEALPSDRALNRLCTEPNIGAKCIVTYPSLIGSHKAAGSMLKDSDREDVNGFRKVGETWQIVFSTRLHLQSLMNSAAARIFKSQWPEKTMVKEIKEAVEIPRGEGVFVKKSEYKAFDRPG
ncbi:glycosyltransferase family 25 protein [Zopfia rhizophila CBS 207.26]|uniref:Glycosyltransferase family 25 protein n=1 Tax=Zopfia rhizophila CBS 207.26 TaxID=1314779 RepID=A0A6A6DMH4_9PEZI|nr:glycosyltransferase family 25 protein [Zopfia rhizophila CBS 207.26]